MSEDNPSIPQFGPEARRALFHERVLVLDGALDDDNGTLLMTQLLALSAEDPVADIALWIHSPGGSVPSMLAIRDIMRLIPNDCGDPRPRARLQRGAVPALRGHPGQAAGAAHARILMHQGSAGIGGSAGEIETQADDLRHMRDTVLGLISADTGQPLERIFEDSLHDRWYTATQAQDYGFIDGIVASIAEVMPRQRARVGLGVTA